MAELSIVGQSPVRVDALEKATGRAKYTSEEGLGVPGMLYGRVLYSPYPHAVIRRIDTSRAARATGVKAVLTGKDVPDNRSGLMIDDRHVLSRERVRFTGDAVAVVAATSAEAAEDALELIDVQYEELPAVFDAEEAMRPDCPVVLHPDLKSYNRPMYVYLGEDLPGPNVHTHHKVRRGDTEAGFRQADLIVENRYQNDRITHCQLEPYNAVAYPETDGSLTVWTSGRAYNNQPLLCRAFNLPPSRLRMKAVYVGGMFGIVARPERFAMLLAMKVGKPVKMVYSREECFIDGLNRLPMVIYLKDGVRSDGTLVAREMTAIVNTGAYSDHAPLTIRNGAFHASQYRLPHYKWDAYGVYSNEPCCGPMRGFGSAECLWATEQQMDIIADKLGLDPLEVRLKNTVHEGEENVRGEIVHSIGAKECMEKAARGIGWEHPAKKSEGTVRTGKGMALANKYTLVDTVSAATVKVHMDGTIEVRHGADECGQGCNTVILQIAAEEFGVTLDRTKAVWGDTAVAPYDFGTASSRSTLYVGNAVRLACQDAKRQMFAIAAPLLDAAPEELVTRDGKIFPREHPGKAVPISAVFLPAVPEARGATKMAVCLAEGGELLGRATFWGHPSEEDPATGQGPRLTMSTAYNAQAVEVAVDTETGLVRILRFCSAVDTGKAINPKACEAQIEGGVAMGIGSALYEGFVFSNNGKLLNPNLHDYRIPSTAEIPSGENLESIIVEEPHPEGPFGAKGSGEISMNPTAPAIANAIYHATGARVTRLPITPERLLEALREAGARSGQ
ncbi:MAG: xanthine dehydrogenase family protein molybdopterin-binding subunit [Chloroflexota bacterium]